MPGPPWPLCVFATGSCSPLLPEQQVCKDPNYELPTRRVKKRHDFGLGADRDPNIILCESVRKREMLADAESVIMHVVAGSSV